MMPPQSEQPEAGAAGATPAGPTVPLQVSGTADSPPPATASTASTYQPHFVSGALFPHEVPSEHWDADFADSKQVYQGTALPLWLLAGWAAFIIWALVYLYYGLSA
ncbi:MAG: hypothetical protein AB7N91_23580 [Candidatus Tectimicrobiota bacterium]